MSYRIPLNRRRSRSTSEAPPAHLSCSRQNDAWNIPSKRGYPSSPGYVGLPSPKKWETSASIWRRGKRFRRSASSQHDTFDTKALKTNADQSLTPSTGFFPATSAEFNLYPSSTHKDLGVNHQSHDAPSADVHDSTTLPDLSRLRSDAFGELRRSVEESGEGLVRRMRDYETTRSRGGVYSKANAPIQLGRKRHSPCSRSRRVADTEDGFNDDDVVQIVAAEELSSEFSGYRDVHKMRAISLGMAESDSHPPSFMDLDCNEKFASPDAAGSSDQSGYTSEDDAMDLVADSSYPTGTSMSSPAPALSHSFYTSTNSSVVSIPSHISGIEDHSITSPPYLICPSPTSSRSEKAIAAITLAMANGAGGLNDYDPLRALEPISVVDDSQFGELWH